MLPRQGKWVKIPLLPEKVDKRSVNNLGTLQRVTTPPIDMFPDNVGEHVQNIKT